MAENTIDTLSLQIESDAQKSFKSIDRLTSSLIGLGKATDRLNAKGLGTFSQDLRTFTSAIRGLKNVTIPDFSGIANSFTKLNGIRLDTASINNVAKSLKGLASVDMGKFNGTDFSRITSSVGQLANIPDVSNSLNRFVSSLQKLANAGDKITPVASELPRLGSSLRSVVNTMAGAATVSEATNMFTQSIGRLATAGAKTTQTADGLDKLAEKTKDFFAAMQNAPQVSENTIRMTQALAQLASAGGNVGKATDSISSGFSRLSSVSSTLSNTVSKVSSAVTRAAKRMVSAFKNIGSSSKHVKTATFNLKSLLKTAVGFGALRGLFNLSREAVEFSSDLTEVQNVVDVTFGNMASKVEELAKTSIGDFGMSELTLKQISSRFQAMGAAMGFSQSKMSDMSIELTKLAADMASFYNVEQADVAKDLESIFTGQTRPLRTYGLDLTQATLAEWAMKNGLDANVGSMTQLQKTMLRYQYVLANTGAAQGDFARTAGTWANQTRILKQNLQQLSGIIGQGLIAALLPAIKVLNVFISGLTKVATVFRDFMYVLTGKKFESGSAGITNVLGDTETYEDDIADAGDAASSALDGTSDSAKKLKKNLDITDYDELRVLKKDADDAADSLGDLGGSGIGDVGLGDVTDGLPTMDDWLKNSNIEQPINEWASRIRSAFLSKDWERLGRTIADGLNKGLKRVYDALNWKKVGPKITSFTDGLTRTFNSLVDSFDWDLLGRTVGTGVNTVINTLNQLIEGTDWKNLGRKFASGINGLFDEIDWGNLGNFLGNKFMIAWDIFSGFVEDLNFAEIGRSFARMLNGVFDKIDFSEIALSITNGINGAFVSLLNFTRTFRWGDLQKNVTNGINTALSNMNWEDAGKSLNAFLLDLGNFMLGIARDVNWEDVGRGIADFLKQIDWATHFNNLINILKEVLGGLWEGLGDSFAGNVVKGIIAFKIASSTLLPFASSLAKALSGKSLIQVAAGGVKSLFTKAFSSGSAEAAGSAAESITKTLETAASAGAGKSAGIFGAIKTAFGAFAEGGVISAIAYGGVKLQELTDAARGGNGEITELGGAIDTLTQRLIESSAITSEQSDEMFRLKEELENSKAGTEEFSAAFIQKLSECGVSSEQLSQAVSEMGGTMNVTDEQGKFLAQTIDGLGSAAETMSGKYVKAGTDADEAFRKIERAIMDTADQTQDYDTINNNLLQTFRDTYAQTDSIDAAYEAVQTQLQNMGDKAETVNGKISSLSDILNQNVNSALGNLSASADTASAATSSIGDTAKNAVANFLGFVTQSGFMAASLTAIGNNSKDADTGMDSLNTTIGNFIKNLATYGTSVYEKGKTSGKNFPLGFIAGQKSKEKDVETSTQGMVDAVVKTTQDGLDEHSPSRLSYGFGENWIQGLINGIDSKTARLSSALNTVARDMARPFEAFEENFRIIGHNLMVSLANGIASVHIPLPHISVSWTKYMLGKSSFSTPNFGINYYAKGGLFTKPGLGILGEGRDDEAALPLNDTVYERIADGIAKHLPKMDIGNIEINRSQAPYVTTSNIPRSTYSNSFGEDLRKDMAAISSNTFNSNANIGQAVRDALNGMAVYADDHIIGYLREKNDESRNQNGGLGFLQV